MCVTPLSMRAPDTNAVIPTYLVLEGTMAGTGGSIVIDYTGTNGTLVFRGVETDYRHWTVTHARLVIDAGAALHPASTVVRTGLCGGYE